MKRSKLSLRLPKGRDISIQVAMIVLGVIGVLMVTSASMSTKVDNLNLVSIFIKQLFFLLVGYVSYAVLARYFSFESFNRLSRIAMISIIALLLYALSFGEVNGAKAWIQVPVVGMTIQPSEFAKLLVILVMANYLGDNRKRNLSVTDLIKAPVAFAAAVVMIVIILQSDLGSGIVVFTLAYVSFLLPGHPKLSRIQWVAIYLMLFGLVFAYFAVGSQGVAFIESTGILKGYQLDRFVNAINPFQNQYSSGYQLVNGLVAFNRGGWLGVGYGNGLQKYGYLPAAKTDFILAVIAEELGFIGVLVIVILYAVMVIRLFTHAYKAQSEKRRMVLVGVGLYIAIHFILNVGGVSALIPLTGVPLLMLSSGGSSTLSLMMALGLAQRMIVDEKRALTV